MMTKQHDEVLYRMHGDRRSLLDFRHPLPVSGNEAETLPKSNAESQEVAVSKKRNTFDLKTALDRIDNPPPTKRRLDNNPDEEHPGRGVKA